MQESQTLTECQGETLVSNEKIASADNQKVIFLPLEAMSVVGAIGGIAEITKEAFSKRGNS